MIRMTLALCAALFVAMLVGGEDRGQKRFGLIADQSQAEGAVSTEPAVESAALTDTVAPAEAPAPTETTLITASFVPAEPVMVTPEVTETTNAALPLVDKKIQYIAAKSVNVRQGPGKEHGVLGRVLEGEAVLVVAEGEGADGWSLIRIEGDGIEGYVASRLLRD